MSQPVLLTYHFAKHWNKFAPLDNQKEDLEDKSKSDFFAKGVAILQIFQLCVSLIVRRIRHFAASQLEIVTVAFAICGVITYICYWYKPQSVGTPIAIRTVTKFDTLKDYQHGTFDTLSNVLTDRILGGDNSKPLDRIPNDNIPRNAYYIPYMLAVFAAAFGSMHAIAWNFEFPTPIERTIWRTATLVSILLPPFALLTILLSQKTSKWGHSAEFVLTCLTVMREYCWENKDDGSVRRAIRELTESYDGIQESYRYNEIFPQDNSNLGFLRKLLKFIEDSRDSLGLSGEFEEQFKQLVHLLNEDIKSKRLYEEARVELYPRRIWLPGRLANRFIIYASIPIYCLARLSIIAVALSSLRLMPESVYTTTWTGVIPTWA